MSRDIPNEVIKQLCAEVNYGCPVPRCGSPFLTWHHFDPPYHVQPHHNPSGMIALCLGHHKMADAGVYSKAQLLTYKSNPFVKDKLSAHWPWEPEELVFILGGSIFFKKSPGLSLREKPIFRAKHINIPETDKERIVFDMNLVDPSGNSIVSMADNMMTLHTHDLDNFTFTAGAKDFNLSHTSGIQLNLRFHRYEPEGFRSYLSYLTDNDPHIVTTAFQHALSHSMDSDELIPVISLSGRLSNSDFLCPFQRSSSR